MHCHEQYGTGPLTAELCQMMAESADIELAHARKMLAESITFSKAAHAKANAPRRQGRWRRA